MTTKQPNRPGGRSDTWWAEELSAYGGRVLHTSLSTEDEERLRVALSGAPVVGRLPAAAETVSLPAT